MVDENNKEYRWKTGQDTTWETALENETKLNDFQRNKFKRNGVTKLLEDLKNLSLDTKSSDICFVVGKSQEHIYAHKNILNMRCKSFQQSSTSISGMIKLPLNYSAEIFRQFILYVYTAKLNINDEKLFELMQIASDLGMEELTKVCEEQICLNISVENACLFLQNVVDASEKVPVSLLEHCLNFIGENASECVKTGSFLGLSKEALIKIISSDHFYLEEENVWRSVLNWAKHQAEVTRQTLHWSEEEKNRVCTHLAPLMRYVRFLLIDSTVFAEEIEPTGAVPIEYVLERYKFAALNSNNALSNQNSQMTHIDRRMHLQPRMNNVIFPESEILSNEKMKFQIVLHKWIGLQKYPWKLVFRGSDHGFHASKFHQICDNLSPLYIIAVGSNNNIAGGFTDVPFNKGRKSGYIQSEKAFLFSLNDQNIRYDIVKKKYALCYHENCGPIFGAGADLLISSQCNQNLQSYSNLPHSYKGLNANSQSLFGAYNFNIINYEVFTSTAATNIE